MKENFRKQYKDLEMKVLHELRNKIKSSDYIDEQGQKAIKIDDETDLTVAYDMVVFCCDKQLSPALQYNGLEYLIDILES